MRHRPLFVLCAALALGAASCGGDGGPAEPGGGGEASGRLAFDFTGDRSGRFSAEGVPPADSAPTAHGTWAGAAHSGGELILVGSRARAAPRVDLLFLVLSDVSAPGTYAIDPLGGGPGVGILVFDVDADASEVDEQAVTYVLTTGSITIEAISAERVRGSFFGDAVRLEGSQRLFVTGGTFDLPMSEDDFEPVMAMPHGEADAGR